MNRELWPQAVMFFMVVVSLGLLAAGVHDAMIRSAQDAAEQRATAEVQRLRDALLDQSTQVAASVAVTCEEAADDVAADPVEIANALLAELATDTATASGLCE